jgi:predicted phage terminase large subunit-like protein
MVAEPPDSESEEVTGWDLAVMGSEKSDRTSYTRMKRSNQDGRFYICECIGDRMDSDDRDARLRTVISGLQSNGRQSNAVIEEPFGWGATHALAISRILSGLVYRFQKPTKDKLMRAQPFISSVNAGMVRIVRTGDVTRDAWIQPFIAELAAFPFGTNDDRVDSTTLSYAELAWGADEDSAGIAFGT